jgi:selT/selW/selH-like putative selenoprotein
MFGGSFLPEGAFKVWVTNNKGMLVGMAFFSNMMAGQCLQTGAFEISYDGQEIFSKLQQNRLPELREVAQLIQKAAAAAGNLA